MSAEAAAVARRAAEIVQERGHCKGRLRDPEGRVCLLGAIAAAIVDLDVFGDSRALISSVNATVTLALRETEPYVFSISWNDRAETTGTDVAKLFLQVADRLDVTP